MQRHLAKSDYFDQVMLTRQPRAAPYFDVPIQFELTPWKKYQYNAGIGYSTDVGPRVSLGILNRRVNDKGHQAEFDASLSSVLSDIGVSYRIPLDKPDDWYAINADYIVENTDTFDSNLFKTGVQRMEIRGTDWLRTVFLNLRYEEYSASGSDDIEYSHLLTPGISYDFVAEDYPARPLSGHRSFVQTQGAVDGLVSDTSFLQLYGRTKWVFRLWSGARLLTRAEAGFTLIDNLDTLPASVRYFAGGDTSVRGYAYKSLGPKNAAGQVVGGENLLVGSVEIGQEVVDNWALAVFIDSGNAYDEFRNFETATGIGFGIRWFSPLGPVRFDLAFPQASDAPDNYRIHITLGPDL
jgi:translocation and assembly module TamA